MNNVKQNLQVYETECKPDGTSKRLMARHFTELVTEFYAQPENVKAFEKWKKKRDSEEK